jgi:phage tail sheath protein FI
VRRRGAAADAGERTWSPSTPWWKYVNVRRRFVFLKESIDEETHRVVFEPNDSGSDYP